jgi:hypothetical protein
MQKNKIKKRTKNPLFYYSQKTNKMNLIFQPDISFYI